MLPLLAGAPGALAAYLAGNLGAGATATLVAVIVALVPSAALAVIPGTKRWGAGWAWIPPLAALAAIPIASLAGAPTSLAVYYIVATGAMAEASPQGEALPWGPLALAALASALAAGAAGSGGLVGWAALSAALEALATRRAEPPGILGALLVGAAVSGYTGLLAGLPPWVLLAGVGLSAAREAVPRLAGRGKGAAVVVDTVARGVLAAAWRLGLSSLV